MGGLVPHRGWIANTQEPRSFKNLLQGHHSRSKNICICKLPLCLSVVQVTSASNKIDCQYTEFASWEFMGTEQHEPLLPSPKVLSWPGCRPSANQGPFFADVSSGLKKGGGCSQSHPTPEVWSPGPPWWGSKQLPSSCICSVTRPELPGPLSCWPGSCLLLTQWPPLVPRLQASRPGAAAHSLSCLQSPAILPPRVSRVGLLRGGVVLGGAFFASQVK